MSRDSDGEDKVIQLRRYTSELASQIVQMAREGKPLRAIASEIGLSYEAIMVWQRKHAAFRSALRQARQEAITAGRRSARGPGTQPKTEQKVATLLASLEGGCSRSHAAALAGINAQTFERWVLTDPAFEQSVLSAEATCQRQALAVVSAAASKQWQAAAWMLERRFPETYARRFEVSYPERVRMAARIGGELADSLVKALGEVELDPEQQEAVRRKLAEALEKAI